MMAATSQPISHPIDHPGAGAHADGSSDFPTLVTERIVLRELVRSDAPELLAIHTDPAVLRWLGEEPIGDLACALNVIDVFAGWRKLPNPGTKWAIERRADGRFLGTCCLFMWRRSWRSCTVGYELGQHAWGRGYMREALSAAIPWGFAQMRLNRIEAQVHPRNDASLRLAKALGFVEEGLLREVGYWDGAYHDLLRLSLLCREFTSSQSST